MKMILLRLRPGRVWHANWPLIGLIASMALSGHAQASRAQVSLVPEGATPPTRLSEAGKLRVREFRFVGNSVFSATQLASVTAPFLNRDITAEDLEEARRQLTLYYVNRGFVNSGAVLKDQMLVGGIIVFTLVEGALTDIQVTGNKRFRTSYLADQIRQGMGAPLNLAQTRDTLELLRQNPNIRRLNAELQPGLTPGEAVLKVGVVEANPYRIALEADNHRPASVGEERVRLGLTNNNLTGRDDLLDVRAGLTRNGLKQSALAGVQDFAVAYRSPLDSGHTSLLLNYAKDDAAVIQAPFTPLGIASHSINASIGLRQTLSRTVSGETALSVLLEHRRSDTSLGGLPFSFSRGDVGGEAKTTALRFGQEWLKRKPTQVLAARSLFSLGADFPGSTDNPAPPNGSFFTWLAQTQYVRLLGNPTAGRQLILRADGQWANRPLLSVEQFPLGGFASVRGYHENELVRDRAIVASTELRFPVQHARSGEEILVLAPFADIGYGVNVDAPATAESNTLSSVGLGVIYTPSKRLNAQVYWGYRLRHVNATGHSLQDRGLHFSLVWNLARS